MDIHVRLNVTAAFSITLATNGQARDLAPRHALRDAVAENILSLLAAGGALDTLSGAITHIEVAEVCDDSDRTIIRGTNG